MSKKNKGYTGNKSPSTLFPKIINSFPLHEIYYELFAGSAQIFRKKKRANYNVLIELDPVQGAKLLAEFPDVVVIVKSAFDELDGIISLGFHSALVYLDPPYVIGARRGQKPLYNYELTDDQHTELIKKVLQLQCCCAISHYPCEMYDELLKHGWYRKDIAVCYNGYKATEALYTNYNPADIEQLHETTFVGLNKTDRQRIKRKAARWVKMLMAMPANERQTVMEAIREAPELA